MYRQMLSVLGAAVLTTAVAHAAMLGIPTPHTTLSGIGVISGWKCAAKGDLTVVFNNDGKHIPLLYGTERPDIRKNGQCLDQDHDRVGFVAIMNWGELGDGQHTAVVYDDGVEFDRSTFTVVTTGESFLRSAAGQCVVPDFPAPNENARFIWNQPTQHMELAEVGGAELLPPVEECGETTCPVCEVCRECPDVAPDPLRHIYGNWTVTFRFTYAGCPYANYSLPLSIPSASIANQNGRAILDANGYVEGSLASESGGRRDVSVSGRFRSSTASGTWFNNLGCGGTWTGTKR